MDKPSPLQSQADVRMRAEEVLARHPCSAPVGDSDTQRLLHELQVHQIELEMQNEALREVQSALEESRNRYQDLYEHAPVGYLTLTADGVIVEVNLMGATLLGERRQDLLKSRFDTLMPAEDRSRWLQFFSSMSKPDCQGQIELAILRRDGIRFSAQLDCASQKVGAGGTAIELVTGDHEVRMVLADITEQLEAARVLHDAQVQQTKKAETMSNLSQHLVAAQENLRRSMARELHDLTSPNLAAIGINLDVLELAVQTRDWTQIAERIGDNRALIEDTAASIRDICADLRPPALDYAGLLPAVEAYASQYARRTAIAVDILCHGEGMRFAPEIETALFRIFQEALTNVSKHARATGIKVELILDKTPLCLTVADDGCGFDMASLNSSNGLGIRNMRDMAEFSGGSLVVESTPGRGTLVTAVILP